MAKIFHLLSFFISSCILSLIVRSAVGLHKSPLPTSRDMIEWLTLSLKKLWLILCYFRLCHAKVTLIHRELSWARSISPSSTQHWPSRRIWQKSENYCLSIWLLSFTTFWLSSTVICYLTSFHKLGSGWSVSQLIFSALRNWLWGQINCWSTIVGSWDSFIILIVRKIHSFKVLWTL